MAGLEITRGSRVSARSWVTLCINLGWEKLLEIGLADTAEGVQLQPTKVKLSTLHGLFLQDYT